MPPRPPHPSGYYVIIIIITIITVFPFFLNAQPPTLSDYDTDWGVKLTSNESFIIEAQNNNNVFVIQSYNILSLSQCGVTIDTNNYIFSVSIGSSQTSEQQYFAFIGYNTVTQIAFIGMVNFTDINTACVSTLNYATINQPYTADEHYVLTADPNGIMAYAVSVSSIVVYNLQNQEEVDWHPGSYSNYSVYYEFLPYAVSSTDNYLILVGYFDPPSLGHYIPNAYLIDVRNCSLNVIDQNCMLQSTSWPAWYYNLMPLTFQYSMSLLDTSQSNNYYYQPLYSVSVEISRDTNEVLIGIQAFNTIVRLSVDSVVLSSLNYIDSCTASGVYAGFDHSGCFPGTYKADTGPAICILNMFSMDFSQQRCLLISPLFWSLVIFAVTILIIVLMGTLKFSVKFKRLRHVLKKIFRLTDLIGEGELWMVSFAIFIVELEFYETFSVNNRTLTQLLSIEIQLIKVINITQSISCDNEEEKYSGQCIPSFVYDPDQFFYTEENYNNLHTSAKTILTIQLSNSQYYIKQIQEPIARQSEIIFHNLLFTTVCTEIFGLIFLVFKLILVPLFKYLIIKNLFATNNRVSIVEEEEEEATTSLTEIRKRLAAVEDK
ncbi:unnamed protein product [Didymodactylos carnosus]|uniref:Uncharacterized protein n=1 Tax=Didymodactylos carnosus TaxID=1234261 RepID=A0A8S2F2P2_9BILA|nr:unnamed protein product [Didymodactylos carnosus]CAF4113945.1 unnamed protein product [Didymodactylos carnosus]